MHRGGNVRNGVPILLLAGAIASGCADDDDDECGSKFSEGTGKECRVEFHAGEGRNEVRFDAVYIDLRSMSLGAGSEVELIADPMVGVELGVDPHFSSSDAEVFEVTEVVPDCNYQDICWFPPCATWKSGSHRARLQTGNEGVAELSVFDADGAYVDSIDLTIRIVEEIRVELDSDSWLVSGGRDCLYFEGFDSAGAPVYLGEWTTFEVVPGHLVATDTIGRQGLRNRACVRPLEGGEGMLTVGYGTAQFEIPLVVRR